MALTVPLKWRWIIGNTGGIINYSKFEFEELDMGIYKSKTGR